MKAQDWDSKLFTRVEIEINHDCNRKCWYCPNAVADRKTSGEMSRSTFLHLMDNLTELGFTGAISYHFYNEPLLARDLVWFVQTSRERLPECALELYTNGTLLSLEKFRELTQAGIRRFVVTKHAGEKDYLFDETYQRLGPAEKALVLYQGHTEIHFTNRGGTIEAGPATIPALSPCYIPSFLMVVTHDGNVLPCFEDFHEELGMGNIRNQKLKDIWESARYRSFRKSLRQGKRHQFSPCKNCNRLEVLPT